MKNCITFVHSSKYEGFGMVIVEALSLEKCVISSKCKVGPVEILDSGEYGILFNVGDSTELSKIILDTSSREELRKKYENKAMERALVFDSKVILNEYERIIDE
jgi:glycosyltransferase involved in cell wall biosynthesis